MNIEMSRNTTFWVSPEVWEEVNKRKNLGDSVDDVLREALGLPKRSKEA